MKRKGYSITFLIIVIIFGYLFFKNQERWIGIYYPDKSDLSKYTRSPELKSIDECREWVNSQVYIQNPSGEGYDYECGKNCRFDKGYQGYICKETIG